MGANVLRVCLGAMLVCCVGCGASGSAGLKDKSNNAAKAQETVEAEAAPKETAVAEPKGPDLVEQDRRAGTIDAYTAAYEVLPLGEDEEDTIEYRRYDLVVRDAQGAKVWSYYTEQDHDGYLWVSLDGQSVLAAERLMYRDLYLQHLRKGEDKPNDLSGRVYDLMTEMAYRRVGDSGSQWIRDGSVSRKGDHVSFVLRSGWHVTLDINTGGLVDAVQDPATLDVAGQTWPLEGFFDSSDDPTSFMHNHHPAERSTVLHHQTSRYALTQLRGVSDPMVAAKMFSDFDVFRATTIAGHALVDMDMSEYAVITACAMVHKGDAYIFQMDVISGIRGCDAILPVAAFRPFVTALVGPEFFD